MERRDPKNNIIPQMFDVRPVDRSGDLDWNRIGSVGTSRTDHGPENRPLETAGADCDAPYRPFAAVESDEWYVPGYEVADGSEWDTVSDGPADGFRESADGSFDTDTDGPVSDRNDTELGSEAYLDESRGVLSGKATLSDLIGPMVDHFRGAFRTLSWFRLQTVPATRFSGVLSLALVFVTVLVGGIWSVDRLFSLKDSVIKGSVAGVSLATDAVDNLSHADFESSAAKFEEASRMFTETSSTIGTAGNVFLRTIGAVPGFSKAASGQAMLEGARHLSAAGASLSRMLALVPSASSGAGTETSFLDIVDEAEKESVSAADDIAAAREAFDRVRPEDVPEAQREQFLSVRERLPAVLAALQGFNRNSYLVRELLGANGPRLYLFLFQNNAELRPTGGFIGTYGLLKVDGGHIRKFFVDGIFNPDGQLSENFVPPAPIQKVSAAWSLHDSNWWPDFPTSARKAMFFYEKTGGPTVDGVVTLTPDVIRELLRLTGPVDMPEYGVTVDADNFLEIVQEQVEEKYDRELNQPKKILADLAPILLDRIFSVRSASGFAALAETLSSSLNGKQVLLYSANPDVEALIDGAGWSGRLLETPRDYLSVVHTNLNGYKTDAVIRESVEHMAAVQADGSVLDTVRITRKHTGGNTPYDWFNRVNSDYLRVYVPKGSELVSASGQTFEVTKPPLDYDALGFRRDEDVVREESGTVTDKGGTRISEESGKTVFGNWVYVSPGESVTVEYTYRLPFSVRPDTDEPASYSVLFQKQSGTDGVSLRSKLSVPGGYVADWKSDGLSMDRDGYGFSATLSTDAYYGAVFSSLGSE
ncbi:MAG: DUF4012 domain-containing protein [Candidatus Moranbacteria bacterium]|nr:DUF4012 domain-containing protein [Candidatus Moranbacteria bacterium]